MPGAGPTIEMLTNDFPDEKTSVMTNIVKSTVLVEGVAELLVSVPVPLISAA